MEEAILVVVEEILVMMVVLVIVLDILDKEAILTGTEKMNILVEVIVSMT